MAEQVGAIEVRISADPSKLKAGLASASKALSDFGSKATSVGRNLSLSVTAPLLLAGRQAIRASNEFEGSMTKIKGLVGVAGAEVDRMGETAKKMAANFGASAAQAGDALFYITSAGLRGSDAMDVLEASLKASAAGLGEASTVADLATSALNAYGTANISAIEATDILTKSVREGKLETTELASSMGRVLPLASAMGVSFDQVGAAFAALSRTGTNAAEAATQIRGILSGLLSPSNQASKELKRLGLNAEDLRKQIKEKGLLSALETLKTAFEGNEESAALVFGNVRALSGIMDLLGANVDTTRQIFDSLTNSTGATNSAFDETSKSGAFKLTKAQKELNLAMTELGNEIKVALIPVLQDLSKFLKNVMESFKGLDEDTRQMIIKMAMITAAIGPVILVVGQLATALSVLPGIFAAISGPIGLTVAAFTGLVLAIDKALSYWHNYEKQIKLTKGEQDKLNKSLSQTPLGQTDEEIKAAHDDFMMMRKVMNLTAKDINKLSEGELTKFIDNLSRVQEGNELWDYAKAQDLLGLLQSRLQKVREETTNTNKNPLKVLSDEELEKVMDLKVFLGQIQQSLSNTGFVAEPEIKFKPQAMTNADLDALDFSDMQDAEFAAFPVDDMSEIDESMKALQERIKAIKSEMEMWAEVAKISAQAVAQAFSAMGGQLFGDLQNSSNAFQRFVGNIGAGVTEIIGMLLANAISNAILGGTQAGVATGPAAPFTTPAFIATAVGSVMAAFGSIPAFAQGGMVTGPTLAMVGDNASRKEAIIPFEKMGAFMNMMGGSNVNVNITGEFDGDALRLVVDKSNRNNLNLR